MGELQMRRLIGDEAKLCKRYIDIKKTEQAINEGK
jgi:hypothetical protein